MAPRRGPWLESGATGLVTRSFSDGGRICYAKVAAGGLVTGLVTVVWQPWIDHVARHSEATSERTAFAAYLNAWAKTDFHTEIAGNPVPVKVIVGANDGALTADVMKATYLAWYPNAELEVMANAGHYPMDETPVALATSIEAFLRA